ncbi:MAG: hypothetical protein F6J97_23825 [Leptolyngbya sp. SIO4C1]|nr:hypothetical protein [Leptolyngbya sp. SIO4C1]
MNAYDKNQFLCPKSAYYGEFTPKHLVFNANLQEFSQRVGYISSLETGGKLAPEEAYQQVKQLWKQLKRSYKTLELES